MKRIVALLAAATLLAPTPAFAWGAKGHTLINRAGAAALPASLPAFLHDPLIVDEIATLGPEEDRIKGAGRSWDGDNDSGHFLDLQDDGTVSGVVRLDALPESLQGYADALAAAKTNPVKQGWLPYAIMDGLERVRKDFAYYRCDEYLATHATTDEAKARFERSRALRAILVARDIGDWGHFVADGSQPLHVTIHFDDHHLHSKFETKFVNQFETLDLVNAHMPAANVPTPPTLLTQAQIAAMIGSYLLETSKREAQTYSIDAAGGFDSGSPQAVEFAAVQLGRGAAEFRDLITLAFNDSLNESVGYPYIKVRDVLQGTVVPRLDD